MTAANDHEPAWQAVWIAALEAWSDGNLPQAFHFGQAARARGLDSSELYGLLASIAIGLGRYDAAKAYVEQAAKSVPAAVPGPRYHLIQPWGCGFWGEVDHVIGQLAFAEITGRVPIVHWGARGTYPAPGHDNAWEAYFEPVSSARLGDLEREGLSYFPERWTRETVRITSVAAGRRHADRTSSLHALAATEEVTVADSHNRLLDILPWAPAGHWLAPLSPEDAYRALYEKYLHLKPDLAAEVNRHDAALLAPRPVLAIHFRAQSISKDSESLEGRSIDVDTYLPYIDQFVRERPEGSIFLLTDLDRCVRIMQERYGPRLRLLDAARLADEAEIEVRLKAGVDVHAAAREIILDAYLAARCDFFIGDGASGVSCAIGFLKRWPAGAYNLLRENVMLASGRVHA